MHASPPIRLVDNSLRLSIVIPAVTSAAELEETLLSVLENRPEQCEVIVALACEYDDPWNLRDEVTFVRAPAGASTIGCVNLRHLLRVGRDRACALGGLEGDARLDRHPA